MVKIETITRSDLEARVLKAPRSVVVDFYQASCPPCRVLEPRLERAAQAYAERLPVYRIDIDRDLPVANRFEVMSVTTVLILYKGKEIGRLDGLITEEQLKKAFGPVVEKYLPPPSNQKVEGS